MYLSLIVYFIVSLMRLEAFALGALQMSYYYYYYKPDGHRSFSYAAPFLWNSLPVHIRQANTLQCFKSLLKTHLFKASFL